MRKFSNKNMVNLGKNVAMFGQPDASSRTKSKHFFAQNRQAHRTENKFCCFFFGYKIFSSPHVTTIFLLLSHLFQVPLMP